MSKKIVANNTYFFWFNFLLEWYSYARESFRKRNMVYEEIASISDFTFGTFYSHQGKRQKSNVKLAEPTDRSAIVAS